LWWRFAWVLGLLLISLLRRGFSRGKDPQADVTTAGIHLNKQSREECMRNVWGPNYTSAPCTTCRPHHVAYGTKNTVVAIDVYTAHLKLTNSPAVCAPLSAACCAKGQTLDSRCPHTVARAHPAMALLRGRFWEELGRSTTACSMLKF